MAALYSTEVRVIGGREGRVESNDGNLRLALIPPKELGGKGGATNPEQLFAAGYGACFESAIRHVARTKKQALSDVTLVSKVTLLKEGESGFKLEVALDVAVEGLSQKEAEALVAEAHQTCPYSKAVRGNINVAIHVRAQHGQQQL